MYTDELIKTLDELEINAKEVYEKLTKHLRIKLNLFKDEKD